MKLEIGKRYVRRDGSVTAALQGSNDGLYPFRDCLTWRSYTPNGVYSINGNKSEFDLVAEYTEPTNEFEQRLAACEAKQAEHDALLARIAALLGLSDPPKAEQPEPPSRYFQEDSTIWMIAGDGVYVRSLSAEQVGWIRAASKPDHLFGVVPEITAEQAEAILKGGGL